MSAPSATETAIRDFLIQDVLYDRDLRDLSLDENLIEKGLLDSLSILKVVTFCEEQFGVTIPDQDVVPDNLESVRAMAALVERARGGKA
jgi:acyl carrier protein